MYLFMLFDVSFFSRPTWERFLLNDDVFQPYNSQVDLINSLSWDHLCLLSSIDEEILSMLF